MLGLDAPEVRLELRMKAAEGAAASSPLVMEMGRALPSEAKQRAVRVAGRVYGVPVERLVDFPRTVVAWRLKDVSRFVATDAQRIELTLHDRASSAPVVASVSRRDDGWLLDDGRRLVSGKPTRLIAELSKLRAVDILAETLTDAGRASFGLAPPALTIRVFGTKTAQDEPLLAAVEIGKSDENGFVATPLGGGAVYRVEAALAEHIPTQLEVWKEKWLAKEAPPSGGALSDTENPSAASAIDSDDGTVLGDEDIFPPGAAEQTDRRRSPDYLWCAAVAPAAGQLRTDGWALVDCGRGRARRCCGCCGAACCAVRVRGVLCRPLLMPLQRRVPPALRWC